VALKQQFARIAGVVAAAVALGGLAACDAEPGIAVRVGDAAYSEPDMARIQRDIGRFNEILSGGEAMASSDVISLFVEVGLVRQLVVATGDAELVEAAQPTGAEEFDEMITGWGYEASQIQQIKELRLDQMARDLIAGTLLYDGFNAALEDGAISLEDVQTAAEGVKLNPRYGVFDPASFALTEASYPWAVPEAEPAAEALTELAEVPDSLQ
jgi:hypothetical protein